MIATRSELINLTPHGINLRWDGGSRDLPPSGTIARVEVRRIQAPSLTMADGVPLPVWESVRGAVTGLPDERPGVALIVAQLVAQACPERRDLFFPDEVVRNEAGQVVSCGGLGQVAA